MRGALDHLGLTDDSRAELIVSPLRHLSSHNKPCFKGTRPEKMEALCGAGLQEEKLQTPGVSYSVCFMLRTQLGFNSGQNEK